jgi:hypothetical protein
MMMSWTVDVNDDLNFDIDLNWVVKETREIILTVANMSHYYHYDIVDLLSPIRKSSNCGIASDFRSRAMAS